MNLTQHFMQNEESFRQGEGPQLERDLWFLQYQYIRYAKESVDFIQSLKETLVRSGSQPACPACQSTKLEKLLSVFATAGAGDAAAAARAALPMGPCGSCGHPDGPGSCAVH